MSPSFRRRLFAASTLGAGTTLVLGACQSQPDVCTGFCGQFPPDAAYVSPDGADSAPPMFPPGDAARDAVYDDAASDSDASASSNAADASDALEGSEESDAPDLTDDSGDSSRAATDAPEDTE